MTRPAATMPVESSEPEFLAGAQALIDRALEEVAARYLDGFPPALRAPAEYALATTGKRLRPILCMAAYAANRPLETIPPALYRLSCALEIVHTYSLIHDDLPCMDDDTLRRGRPTVHVVYGSAVAALAGAALLPMAVEVIESEGAALGLDPGERARLIVELAVAAGAEGMVGGQLLDLESEQRPVDNEALEAIHRMKTGALLAGSLRIGALASRASPELLTALSAYGQALGLAFQIADDLLDIEGSSADIGKTAGRDLALEKASYPSLYGIEGARALARSKVAEAKEAIADFNFLELEKLADYVIERRR